MQAYVEVEVLLYTFLAFVPDGILRLENLKTCSAAVSAAATTTTTAAAAAAAAATNNNNNNENTGLVLEDKEEGGEDSQWRSCPLISLPAKTV
jgi:hypothetical protein